MINKKIILKIVEAYEFSVSPYNVEETSNNIIFMTLIHSNFFSCSLRALHHCVVTLDMFYYKIILLRQTLQLLYITHK